MKKLYKGTIVEESLEDTSILNNFTILEETKPRDQNDWHLYIVEGDCDAVILLSKALKHERWYAHFWYENEMIVVFCDKLFFQKVDDQTTWSDAIAYGISAGIPKEQLNFLLEE